MNTFKKYLAMLLLSILFVGCGSSSSSGTITQLPSVDKNLSDISKDTNISKDLPCSAIPVTQVLNSSQALTDATKLSSGLLESSNKLLTLSDSLVDAGSSANTEYVDAILELSDDILTMADKIGDMADKILVMADNIGDMSDRILETQRIQSKNVELTQTNILKSQENLNSIK